MTNVHFSWKQLDGIVNTYMAASGVVTITPISYNREDKSLVTDASSAKRVSGEYDFNLPPNSNGTFYQFELNPNGGSTVIEYRFVPDNPSIDYVDLPLVDKNADFVTDPSVPPWIAELEALKKSGDFFVTQVEVALDVASNHSAKAEQYAANAETSATAAEASAKKAFDQAADISTKVELATDSAEDSKASAARAFSSAEDSRTYYESSVQIAGFIGESVAEVGAIRDQAAASAAEAKSSETNAGSSASSAKADADRAALAASNSSKSATAADESAKAASSHATKAASSAAKSEQEAVKAVDAASMLNADAKAFGDAVRSGTFKGDTGPANQLDVIETKTVAPTTPASVVITGDAPNQHLSFAIPKGDEGAKGDKGDKGAPGALTNASTYNIVGPGRPDVPSSTAGTITGGESVGATYYSEDGAGVGAYVWRKRPRGAWAVVDGDTGWRGLIAATTGMFLNVRRTPDGVFVYGGFLFTGGGTRPVNGAQTMLLDGIYTDGQLPVGFRPDAPTQAGTRAIGSMSATVRSRADQDPASSLGTLYVNVDNGDSRSHGRVVMKTIAQGFGGAIIEYPTLDPWPSTLPGTPA